MSAPEAAYFPAFEDRRADPEDPGGQRLELELRALRARVHFLEAWCQALEGQRPAPSAEQIDGGADCNSRSMRACSSH